MSDSDDDHGSKPRCAVYIDGFNLYNGSIKGTRHKWLNLQRMFELLRPDDDVTQIRYFTALMSGESGTRQQTYLDALSTLSKVSVVVGRYKRKTVMCHAHACTFTGNRRFKTWEEKRTDVSIAVQIVADAYEDMCDNFVVVSGDSDLVPALHQVKMRFPEKKVIVYIPARDQTRGAAVEMRSAGDRSRTLPMDLMPKCQLPPSINTGSIVIEKPPSW